MKSRLVTMVAAIVVTLAATLALPNGAPALLRNTATEDSYSLSAQALLGLTHTDLYLTVASTGASLPGTFDKVRVKVLSASGKHLRTVEFVHVKAPDGMGVVVLKQLHRNQILDVTVEAEVDSGKRADHNDKNIKLRARTTVRLRPDLSVRRATAPARVVRTHPFTVEAEIAEVAGDTGAHATVSLSERGAVLASTPVDLGPGASATVSFPLQYPVRGGHTLRVAVFAATPAEAKFFNNKADASVNVAQYDFDGAVSSDIPEVTTVGRQVLEGGGNAVDAAVAMQFALAVTEPQNVGLGGGATIVLHMDGRGDFAIDAREISPAATDPDQYHAPGNVNLKTNGNSSGFIVGVPGSLKAAEVLLEEWGTISLSESLQPAISLAQDGFTVGKGLSTATEPGRRCQNVGQPETKALFCTGSGLAAGSMFVQPDLAKTFRLIADQGTDVFYRGEIAPAIVEATRRTRVPDGSGVGNMTVDDVAAYDVGRSTPISTTYRGYKLESIGASSAGGIVALQALKMLERFPLGDESAGFGWMGPNTAHVMAEAMGVAFADYFYWMGGGAVPVEGLLSDWYLAERGSMISLDSRIPRVPNPNVRLPAGNPFPSITAMAAEPLEPMEEFGDGTTSHFSVLDKNGNAVSFTTTLTDAFGSGILVPGYGFVLNDALSNFQAAPVFKEGAFPSPGNPGMNDPGPSKRARGNTAPLIAFKGDEPVIITGSPGSASIPSVVLNVVSNMIDHGMGIQEAVDRPRMWFNMSTVLWNVSPSGPQIPEPTLAHVRAFGPVMSGPQPLPNVGGAESIAIDPTTFALSVGKDRLILDASAELVPPR